MFIPGRKRRRDGIQCMCRKTLDGILKFDRHCSLFLNLFYGVHYAFASQQEEQDTRSTTQLKSTASVFFSDSDENQTIQNISDVAVTIKFDQGHQNWHENSTFTGDYPMAQFERFHLKSVQEGTKIQVFVEFVKA